MRIFVKVKQHSNTTMAKLVSADLTGDNLCTLTYTTSDGEMLSFDEDAFDAKIISHSYTDKGEILFDKPITFIDSNAFANCGILTSVTIPDSVTEVGFSAFRGCTGELIINSRTLVESNYHCWGSKCDDFPTNSWLYEAEFTKLTIGSCITSIGSYAFYGCSSLLSVAIGNGVASIGHHAFAGCHNLIKVATPDSITRIQYGAFQYCTSLANITIPNGITFIEGKAFKDCKSLTSIAIPDNVTSIGKEAFFGCKSLTSITIPDSVTSIGDSAFAYCESLTSITIPDSVTEIGENVFGSCSSLSAIYGKFATSDNRGLIVNSVLNSIAPAGLTQYIIPDSVTSIGRNTFDDSSGLASITIPESVVEINNWAFESVGELIINSRSLVEKDYNDDNSTPFKSPSIDLPVGDLKINSFTKITIGKGIVKIGNRAFEYCLDLTSIAIPDSVTSIGAMAFWGCRSLKRVDITDLSAWCKISFRDAFANPCCVGAKLYINGVEPADITIPSDVTEIGLGAFSGCKSLISITIPSNVKKIGFLAFKRCSNLTKVNITNLTDWCKINFISNPLENGAKLYLNKAEVRNLVIPSDVSIIRHKAFSGCCSLKSLIIPNSVTEIEAGAFEGCSNLISVLISDSVTSIGCSAFRGCTSLTSITIGNSVTSIHSYAFSGCSSVKTIICKAKTPPTLVEDLGRIRDILPKFETLIVPEGCEEAYLNSDWRKYIVEEVESDTE